MPRRQVTWNMSRKYSQGWMRGTEDTRAEYDQKYHLRGVSYSEIFRLVQEHGTVSLRRNTYPMVFVTLPIIDESFYLVFPIGQKHRWTRFQQWAKGSMIQLVWEGENAQSLIRKIIRYMKKDSEVHVKALKALTWTPTREDEKEEDIEKPSLYADPSAW